MNTKGIKFLAVLAVLAMAFAAFAVVADSDDSDAATAGISQDEFFKPAEKDPATSVRTGTTLVVTLLKNVEITEGKLTVPATIDGTQYDKITIDLNGHKLKSGIEMSAGTLTISGKGMVGAITATQGKLTIEKDVTVNGNVTIGEEGVTEVSEVAIKGAVYGQVSIIAPEPGTASTEVTIDSTAKIGAPAYARPVETAITSANATLTIKGEVVGIDGVSVTGGTLYVKSGAVITADNMAVDGSGAMIELQGGTITGIIKGDDNTAAVEKTKVTGGTYSDYSVFKYASSRSTGANVNAGGIMIPGAAPKTTLEGLVVDDEGVLIIPASKLASGTTIFDFNKIETDLTFTKISIDAGDKKVVFIGKDGAVNEFIINVNNGAVAFYGYTTISGTVNQTVTASKTTTPVAFSGLTGQSTFSKGALDADVTAGTITLGNGEELVLSGTLAGATIEVEENGSAKVIIEAGDDKALEVVRENSIAAKIAVDVYGKIFGYGTIAVDTIEAFDGAIIDGVTVDATKSAVAWSGSDINYVEIPEGDFELWSGKDSSNGTWAYKDGKLTIINYNGTYNFYPFLGKSVVVKGDVVISYSPVEYISTYFAGDIATEQDGGSLTLNVDLTQVEVPFIMEMMNEYSLPVSSNTNLEDYVDYIAEADDYLDEDYLDDVKVPAYITVAADEGYALFKTDITVNVSGTPALEAFLLKFMPVIGFAANGNLYNSSVNVDVLSDEGYGIGVGALISGTVTNCETINAKGSMVGAILDANIIDADMFSDLNSTLK